jgi:hypothetical protein
MHNIITVTNDVRCMVNGTLKPLDLLHNQVYDRFSTFRQTKILIDA